MKIDLTKAADRKRLSDFAQKQSDDFHAKAKNWRPAAEIAQERCEAYHREKADAVYYREVEA